MTQVPLTLQELQVIAEIMHEYVKEGYPSAIYGKIENKMEAAISEEKQAQRIIDMMRKEGK